MACSLVKIGKPPGERYDYLYKKWLDLSGGIDEITMDNAVYLSERYDSDRNFALAHLMKSKNVFPPNTDITDILELYF
jgi:glutaminase